MLTLPSASSRLTVVSPLHRPERERENEDWPLIFLLQVQFEAR